MVNPRRPSAGGQRRRARGRRPAGLRLDRHGRTGGGRRRRAVGGACGRRLLARRGHAPVRRRAQRGGGMKVLIVDDHAIVRDGLARLLATDGEHEIALAANGRDATLLARSFRPAVTILDLNLPGLGGLELLRRLVAIGAGRILVLSMHAEPLYARRSLEAGAHGYVSKNAAPDELLT